MNITVKERVKERAILLYNLRDAPLNDRPPDRRQEVLRDPLIVLCVKKIRAESETTTNNQSKAIRSK